MKKLHTVSLISLVLIFAAFPGEMNAQVKVQLKMDENSPVISKNIYGQFSEHLGHCIYGGIYVGEDSKIPNTRGIRNDVVKALRDIEIPNLRWPGGCFADEYHWMDGIGPKDSRPRMVNTHWGGVVEDNSFGTHEFLDLCEQLGTEPYICGNMGSGSVEEMSKWIEYITFGGESPMSELRAKNGHPEPWKVKFWGVGNENWGCGGNMTPEFYSDNYRRYATYCRNYGDNRLVKIAGGPNSFDYNWMEVLMKAIPQNLMQGVSLHYYTVPKNWSDKGSATQFDESEYFTTILKALSMEELVSKHSAIMDKYDPEKKVGLMVDEWGAWYNVEEGTNPGFLLQQNTLRDAILSAVTLNIFNNHCDRVKMSNIAQMVNVLQSLILTDEEKMVLTPTYYVYNMYKVHHDATLIAAELTSPDYNLDGRTMKAVSVSASKDKNGAVHISLVNIDPHRSQDVKCLLGDEAKIGKGNISGTIITAASLSSFNSFDHPDMVKISEFKGGSVKNGIISAQIPPMSVVTLELK
ncbi:MAG: alpha-N-arabinofuranosidase [Bacteroidales bacterium]|nr:alpha-N-arabinofuranosidase [Bacteroidales bacterium]MCP5515566.1 alpha-N-arabinofuranosidase [Spirochaetales bacterium]